MSCMLRRRRARTRTRTRACEPAHEQRMTMTLDTAPGSGTPPTNEFPRALFRTTTSLRQPRQTTTSHMPYLVIISYHLYYHIIIYITWQDGSLAQRVFNSRKHALNSARQTEPHSARLLSARRPRGPAQTCPRTDGSCPGCFRHLRRHRLCLHLSSRSRRRRRNRTRFRSSWHYLPWRSPCTGSTCSATST